MNKTLGPIISLLIAVSLLLSGNGLQFTLLPLRGRAEGFSEVELGVIGSAYFVGFVAGCVFSPQVVMRVGHIRTFSAAVAMAAAAMLAHALVLSPLAWLLLRLVSGFCLAGFYLVVESWLNDRASNETRGLVMSVYIVINFASLTIGQLLVTQYPIAQAGGFLLAAMLIALAIVPVALTRAAQPAPITIVRFEPHRLYGAAPVAFVASFMIGIANGAFWGMGALSAASSGLSVRDVAIFMSSAVMAGAVAQWPLGRLSDRFDRRIVMAVLLIGSAATGAAIWLTATTPALLLALGCLFGALALPCYSLAAAHGYDKTSRSDVVATAATILLLNGLGSAIGPLVASAFMAVQGARGLFLFTALAQILLAAYVVYRTRVQASLAPPEKMGFDLAATAPVGTAVAYELVDPPSEAASRDKSVTRIRHA